MFSSLRYFLFALLFAAGALTTTAAQAAIKVDISCGSIDFGTTNVGATADRTFTITNESSSSGTTNIQLHSPSGTQFWIVGGWEPFTLAPGQTHMVTIRFSPASSGSFNDQITITDNGDGLASANPYTVRLSGVGAGNNNADTTLSVCTCSWPNSFTLDFGSVSIGVTGSQRFTILDNSSAQTIRHLIGTVSGTGAPFSITFGQGYFDLASGYGHDVVIGFTPTHQGAFLDSIVILSNTDAPSTRRIVIYLTGNAGAGNGGNDTTLTLNFNGTIPINHDLDFGSIQVGKTASLTFVIQDASSGATRRQLIGLVGSINPPFSISNGSGTFLLNSGGLWTVTINFVPSNVGSFRDSVVIFSNADDPNSRRIVLYCMGVGLPGNGNGGNDSTARLSISGLTQVLNFGLVKINDIGLRYFTITNTSDANINVSGNISTPRLPYSNASNNGGSFILAKGGQMPVFIKFAPTTLGQFYDSIVVTSNAPNAPSTVVYLVGTSATAGVTSAALTSGMSVYPNPFTTTSTLKLDLAQSETVKIGVYNLLGQEVAHLANGTMSAGEHTFDWHATNLGNGTYFYRAQIGSETRTARVVLSR